MRKDKEKVLDEVWTEDRVRSFLQIRSHDATETDFHMLLKAYQSMRASDFDRFIELYREAGHDINATNIQGESVLSIVRQHRRSGDYATLLEAAGASD